ncbi:hypothetical protein CSU02_22525 [Salmonella enterica subsp. enterica serovar Adjame]|nr:hypothetical protein [Salmonella enterica subsp. enterica serovar Adjame]EDM3820362.1 hypothetical protein [Salmonella enterica subsp. enterica serovar Adjame]EDM4330797.1 hypothetical protein [Salmonella enterica subsp. enterica serovar Adjame]
MLVVINGNLKRGVSITRNGKHIAVSVEDSSHKAASDELCLSPPPERLISRVVEPDRVSLTGLIDTGASFDAPVWPTIEMQWYARHKKSANAPCVVDEIRSGG